MKYRWLSLTEDVFTLELFEKKKIVTRSQPGLAVFLVHVFHFDIISWTAVRIMLIIPSGNINHKGLFIIWFNYLKIKVFPSYHHWNISNIAKEQLFQRFCSYNLHLGKKIITSVQWIWLMRLKGVVGKSLVSLRNKNTGR